MKICTCIMQEVKSALSIPYKHSYYIKSWLETNCITTSNSFSNTPHLPDGITPRIYWSIE